MGFAIYLYRLLCNKQTHLSRKYTVIVLVVSFSVDKLKGFDLQF